jgi:hypothetical protein
MILKTPQPIRLYDLSIPDLEERKQKALDFLSLADAATFLGVAPNTVRNNIGSRILCHKLGKRFAVRVVSLANGQVRADPKRA